jgi:ABC-2 type transport system permease protein
LGLSLLLTQVNANLLLLAVGMIMIAACLAMYRYMQTKGEQLFQRL